MGQTKIYIPIQSYPCNLPRIKVLSAFETKANPYLFPGLTNFMGSFLQASSKGVRNLAHDFPLAVASEIKHNHLQYFKKLSVIHIAKHAAAI